MEPVVGIKFMMEHLELHCTPFQSYTKHYVKQYKLMSHLHLLNKNYALNSDQINFYHKTGSSN